MKITSLAIAALLPALACAPSYDGPEKVKDLRLLAVQAEPPEIGAPGDSAQPGWPAGAAALRSLVAHPQFAVDGAPRAIVLHLACTPQPGDPSGTACTQMSELSQPAELLRFLSLSDACTAPGRGEVNAITFAGLEACDRQGCGALTVPLDPAAPASAVALPTPGYALPAGFSLAALPAGHTQRILGVEVVDLALVVAATPAEVAPAAAVADPCAALGAVLQRLSELWPGRENVAALKWIHVRGPDMPAESPPNHNPTLAGITLEGVRLPAPGGTPAAAVAGQTQALLPDLGGSTYEALRERYRRYDTDAEPIDMRDETWAYSWFTSQGELDLAHTDGADPRDTLDVKSGRTVIWLVVRDLRGGMAWSAGEIDAP